MRLRFGLALVLLLAFSVLATPHGSPPSAPTLTEDDPLGPVDVALALEGTGATATSVAESWR